MEEQENKTIHNFSFEQISNGFGRFQWHCNQKLKNHELKVTTNILRSPKCDAVDDGNRNSGDIVVVVVEKCIFVECCKLKMNK